MAQSSPSAARPRVASSADEAVSLVRSGMRIFVHGAAATPTPLLEALVRRADLTDVELYHLHTSGPAPFVEPPHHERFHSISMFTGAPVRAAIADGLADFMPVFLSDIPSLFLTGRVPLDVAFLQLSPPDAHGFCSLGTSVDAALAASLSATIVIAEINARMPRTLGNTLVPYARLDACVHTDRPLVEHPPAPPSAVDDAIGAQVARLVEDGATLQMGIGAIPDAVLRRLGDKHDLGVHTEMFSDGILDLVEGGVITNRRKKVHQGRIVTSFVVGSERLHRFVDDNALVEFHPCDRTNDTSLIRKNDRVVAINSALEIDLSGQVVADSIGFRIYSGIGGQMDFIRGAALSAGGKPIIALPSTAAGGRSSRIVSALKPGAGVVTTRGHVHWVVTEHGAVNLFGLSLQAARRGADRDRAPRRARRARARVRERAACRAGRGGRLSGAGGEGGRMEHAGTAAAAPARSTSLFHRVA
ncbi:MAG: acetyl-CoA hydrolase/transferase C-terminal domain-containing protein [Vicinamibacterales bacterium]